MKMGSFMTIFPSLFPIPSPPTRMLMSLLLRERTPMRTSTPPKAAIFERLSAIKKMTCTGHAKLSGMQAKQQQTHDETHPSQKPTLLGGKSIRSRYLIPRLLEEFTLEVAFLQNIKDKAAMLEHYNNAQGHFIHQLNVNTNDLEDSGEKGLAALKKAGDVCGVVAGAVCVQCSKRLSVAAKRLLLTTAT